MANKASFFSPTTSLNVIGMVQQPHVASIALSHDEHSSKLALILRSYEQFPNDMLPVCWPTAGKVDVSAVICMSTQVWKEFVRKRCSKMNSEICYTGIDDMPAASPKPG